MWVDVLYTTLGSKKKTNEFPIYYKRSLLAMCVCHIIALSKKLGRNFERHKTAYFLCLN